MAFAIRPRIRRAFRLALRRRDLTDDEIDEEIRSHVEMRSAQLVARGLTLEQAEAEAHRRFGELARLACRSSHRTADGLAVQKEATASQDGRMEQDDGQYT